MRRAGRRDPLAEWTPPSFRFDQETHTYTDLVTGKEIAHITGILTRAGKIDDRWWTDEDSERGSAVHALTAQYDLGALDVPACVSTYRGWLLGYVKAMSMMRPEWLHVEEPFVLDRPRFGGRPDRVGKLYGAYSILEIKSGAPKPADMLQTALQALLVAPIIRLPAEGIVRYAGYFKNSGKFKVEMHTNRSDFYEVRDILARFT